MTAWKRLAGSAAAVALGLLVAGCNPAGQYGTPSPPTTAGSGARTSNPEKSPPAEPKKEAAAPAVAPELVWMEPKTDQMEPAVPIVFVTETGSPFEWNKLTKFWTHAAPPAPAKPPAGKPAKPPAAPPAPAVPGTVKIKVPRGLPDPIRYIPASNLPTVGKWELGKRLFFDDSYLSATSRQSCATCHRPDKGFSEGLPFHSPRTMPLVNVVYNQFLFWDGRANALEEVIQRHEAHAAPNPLEPDRPLGWSGVIERLRKNADYNERFLKVFGTPPTEDAVGKALATYLRTILAGDSLYDQAEAARNQRKASALEAADFGQALKGAKDEVIKALDGDPKKKDDLARRLAAGTRLFHDTGCIACHPGPVFHDNGFHNLGIGDSAGAGEPGHEPGRFAALPVGEKDPQLIGAYKTPMLRLLSQTGPYFHNASETELFQVVVSHVRVHASQVNPHLDPLLRDDKDPTKGRDLHLKEDDVRNLVAFLKTLDGNTDAVVREPDNWPDGTKRPKKP